MNVKSKLLLLPFLVLLPLKTTSNTLTSKDEVSIIKVSKYLINEASGLIGETTNTKPKVKRLTSSLDALLSNYIIKHEGFVDSVYRCPSGVPTIGWGHVILKKDSSLLNKKISKEEALNLLYLDINKRKSIIDRLNKVHNLNLNKNQKASLTHFIYALGEGTLIKSSLFRKIKNKNKIIKSDFTVYCKYKRKGKYVNSNYMKKMRKWEYNLYIKT